jgi:transglycosylase-like protein with SLT domain
MKRKSSTSLVWVRWPIVVLTACAVLFLAVEISARPRKRSASAVRRSHSAKTGRVSSKTGDDVKALNVTPQLTLMDNTTIPVDDAWESAQGIWYRKDGVTYLVERSKVRAIERGTMENSSAKQQQEIKVSAAEGAAIDPKLNPVWIYLVGGARVEADDATESTAGVWLRRGSLSVFIERARIERIEREESASVSESKASRGWSTGSSSLNALIKQNGARYGVDPYLIFLVMEEESHFNPRVVSPKGARGLMQLMPGTGARFGVRNPFNAAENISGGVRYLKQLLQTYNGRVDLALASYNAGEGAVAKWGHRVPPYRETRNYVKRIGGRYRRNDIAQTVRRGDPQSGTN